MWDGSNSIWKQCTGRSMSHDEARNRKGKQEQCQKSLGRNVSKILLNKHRQVLTLPPSATIATSRNTKRSTGQQKGLIFLRLPLGIRTMIWSLILTSDQHVPHIYTTNDGGFRKIRCDLKPFDHNSDYYSHEAQQATSSDRHFTAIGALKRVEGLIGEWSNCCMFK